MSLTLFSLGCIVAARSALAPMRKSLRAPDGILSHDLERRERALNALGEVDHHLQRLALLIDPTAPANIVHEGNVVLDAPGEKSA